ncbi:MAG: hypothetical protein A3D24_00300 [Candidatus Blackburnbacteria bacterium RIFCSPHIGHO2_02_FULL_39_13]|uniref:Uncharacterized protein n=1 Tax=Candidatus Blackburnbacteria bacterium RIFCSPLOWO2_01_FULL_40_20 TaxID=1797519 RepID=A0A1G1VF59_9BACT|nr:MAG: hypothetical protein A2694_02390 [Candidatus Blackburnbacteria bacterium RIFCSPHIGHO2_01_FULL_40_17]OGY09460.1 MAG: hypothetical protein A3D24_00300 [Candidatus Blackburnbacteria bacterium RIFCSPHIGHO2_02_FULL_39_13]OGY14038.1 MAG: hypothetical protein A3A77_03515 [Candidatus Blackburnbacteria bacterium RIFCSPLOWO2_01_FULL_40_20]OGY15730.1 MAG: hypothetical protein A3I52_01550 [Candidatus Blackburnbacteria bacterium RIFCSPLOWO2_02_FULL_40_10]HBL51627.1 hypothetical protein [Candidatus B
MQPTEGIHRPVKQMLWHNFWGGIFWALGTTVGFAIVIVVVTFALKALGGVPLIGGWIAVIIEATNQVLEARKSL